jgi:hypothetical protein
MSPRSFPAAVATSLTANSGVTIRAAAPAPERSPARDPFPGDIHIDIGSEGERADRRTARAGTTSPYGYL